MQVFDEYRTFVTGRKALVQHNAGSEFKVLFDTFSYLKKYYTSSTR